MTKFILTLWSYHGDIHIIPLNINHIEIIPSKKMMRVNITATKETFNNIVKIDINNENSLS
jgi:hypothetical protein